jgi:hypothetical protein
MADTEVIIDDGDKKEETPVSFVESDDATLVTIGGEEKKSSDRSDSDRWERAEAQQNRLAQGFDELRSRLAGGGNTAPSGPSNAADPYQAELDSITAQERALGIEWEALKRTNRLSHEELNRFDAKSRDLQQRRIDIGTQRAVQNVLPRLIEQQQRVHYSQQYGDVQSHPQANMYARGQFDILRSQGYPDSPATVDLAMNAARAHFRMPGARQQPTEQDRQQLTGFSGNNRRNMAPKDNVVKMGKSEKIMAMAMYGDAFNGDEKKAYAQWAKGPGIRAQKAMQQGRRNQQR